MPLRVRLLKITVSQSTAVAGGRMPSSAILPPWHMLVSRSRNAWGLPDISIPTSKPSFIPSFFWVSAMEPRRTSSAMVAPIFLAISSRKGFTSVTTT